MAYKFQLGAFTASGSIKAEEGFDADGQEASNFATLSNGGSDITIAENAEVLGNVRISGSNALELGDSQHAIKNLANNLELQVGGNTVLEIQSGRVDAKQDLRISGSGGQHALEFGGDQQAIKDLAGNLEFHVGGNTKLEVKSSETEAKQHVLMSGSQEIRFGGNNSAIFKADGVENLELKANGATRLEIQSAQIESKTHVRLSGSSQVQFGSNQNRIEKAPSAEALEIHASNGKRMEVKASAVEFLVDISGSGNLTLAGDLTVNGTTTTVNSTTLTVDDRLITIGDGLADLAAGVSAAAGFEIGANLASMKLDTNVDGNGLDGFTVSLPLKATSFHGDGSALTGVAASDAVVSTFDIDDAATDDIDSAGFWLAGSLSQDCTVTLANAGSWVDGEVVYIKNQDANNKVTISPDGSDTIDGAAQNIELETQGAAVTLIRKGTTAWFIV